MPNIVTVTKIDSSKNGKPRVYFGGKHNWHDAYYVGQKCGSLPTVGATIDAEVSSKDFNSDGKLTWFLNGWKFQQMTANNGAPQQQIAQQPYVQTNTAPKQSTSTYNSPGPYAPTPIQSSKPPAGWEIPGGDLSRFVSNVLGSAIEAGLIKSPHDIAPWTAAAYRAGNDLRTGKVKDFDDVVALPIKGLPYAENDGLRPIEDFPDGADPNEDQGYGEAEEREAGF